ncbi:MAG: hypothetical protein HN742_15435 [Lentisphaerae bacterium]|jgi:uncharacterized repeat protein (TIGR04138 family)|nr:hypothetical protein [Lentisphaerota bacterium]MBT5604380.1 hypothetical protein [Lentisphaerota bacterium]MBT7055219.1 hypothetical protein [Lentisphaerota bacterium]MBT7843270.1 hypothetical protein [Lentisphaerota bacterium]
MNSEEHYRERLQKVIDKDPRYPAVAYDFVRAGVSFTGERLREEGEISERFHITGQQLLEGLRDLALNEFGPLAYDVLAEWNVTRTGDFGNLVFNLVESNLLGASEDDSPEDFADGYSFPDAFLKPFVETGEMPDDLSKIA